MNRTLIRAPRKCWSKDPFDSPRLMCLLIVAALLVSMAIDGHRSPASAASAAYDWSRVEWSELSYRASKLGVSINSEVELSKITAAEAAAALVKPAEGTALVLEGPESVLMTMHTKGLGENSRLDLWLDPLDGTSIQRTQHSKGKKLKKNRYRTLRYVDGGVWAHTRRPTDTEVGGEPDKWSKVYQDLTKFPKGIGNGLVITEPAALFYIVSAAELTDKGDTTTIHVFSRNHVMKVVLKVEEMTRVKVDYVEESPSGKRTVKGNADVRRISLDGSPADPGAEEGDFEFMGLRGDINLYLDQKTHVPVQFSGKIKMAGKGNVRLKRVVLK